MGLLSSIASFFGAKAKGKAAVNAANAQVASAQQGIGAIDTANQGITAANTLTQGNLNPFIQGGQQSLSGQLDLLGLNGPQAQQAALDQLKMSPTLAAQLGQGQDLILGNASATGGLRGGNVQGALGKLGADSFANLIQQQLSNLSGLTSLGAQTGVQAGQLGLQSAGQGLSAADQLAELFGDQGQAKAGGIIGKANARAQQYGSLASGIGGLAGAFLPGLGGAGGLGSTLGKLI